MAGYKCIEIGSQDGVTTLTLNRPEKRNAISPLLGEEMYDALIRLEMDASVKVLVVTGAGSSFCAGMDLKEYFRDVTDDGQRNHNRRVTNDWCDRLLRMFPRPTIAKVNGHCYGGAFTIVASCDFAIAAEDATFGLSEVNWGALPAGLVSKVISTLMPYREALYYSMTGDPFDGRRAAELHFVNRAVPAVNLDEETAKLAAKLAGLDPHALRATKEAFKQVVDMTYDQAYWWLMSKSNELRWRHDQEGTDYQGIDKFLSKQYRPAFGSFTQAESHDS